MSLDYVVDLARKNTDALGFIPRPKLERYDAYGQILIARENEEPSGYLVFGNGWPALLPAACIQYDARRREQGRELVCRLEGLAHARGVSAISLWCASDLEANEFWRSAGFEHVVTQPARGRRQRERLGWRKELELCLQPPLIGSAEEVEHAESG